MTTTTQAIKASYDAHVSESSADGNFGDATLLRLQQDPSGQGKRSFFYFPLTLPDGATVISAVLKVYCKNAWSGTRTITAKRVTQAWKEGTITWNNAPAVTDTNLATLPVTAGVDGQALLIPITAMAQQWANGAASYGVRLAIDSTGERDLYSSEGPTQYQPELSISWATTPDAPTNLRPNGARAVSTPKPILMWNSSTPTQTQVQLDDTVDFTGGIEYDSGWQVNSSTQWDLAATAYGGVTNGATKYWRARVQDENGIMSDWSPVAQFQYDSLGTLAITSPATDGASVLTTTPTITHTFTSRTQQYVEYLLYEDGVLIYHRDKQVQTALTFTLPPGYVRLTSATYKIIVHVWDTFDREANGDNRDFVEQTRTFVLALSGGVISPVTSLVVVGENGHVRITWSRATAPDYFALRVDGLFVFDRILPADVLVSGTNYGMNFYRASPRDSHTYEVIAVGVDSGILKLSGTNPSQAYTWKPVGMWLVDEDYLDEAYILGADAIDTSIGETGATFMPLGRQDPVRVMDAVRGLEGSASGIIAAYNSYTVAASKLAFQRIKGRASTSARLIYSYRNIPVVLGESSLDLVSTPEEAYTISFDFWQTAEFEVEMI